MIKSFIVISLPRNAETANRLVIARMVINGERLPSGPYPRRKGRNLPGGSVVNKPGWEITEPP
jgi:hypothetical protein